MNTPGVIYNITAKLVNIGSESEINVPVSLLFNDTVMQSMIIPSIAPLEEKEISFERKKVK